MDSYLDEANLHLVSMLFQQCNEFTAGCTASESYKHLSDGPPRATAPMRQLQYDVCVCGERIRNVLGWAVQLAHNEIKLANSTSACTLVMLHEV